MRALVIRILAWFGPCVAAWWFLAPLANGLVATPARVIAAAIAPGAAREVEVGAAGITFVTGHRVGGGEGVVTVDVNPRLYTFGFALLAAIVLGARSRGGWWKLAIGAVAVILLAQAGSAFDFLAHLMRSVPEALAASGLTAGRANAVALGYQLLSLLLPSLVPAALGVALAWQEIEAAGREAPPAWR